MTYRLIRWRCHRHLALAQIGESIDRLLLFNHSVNLLTHLYLHFNMIHAVLIFNTNGKPRLSKFFTPLPPLVQQSLISQIFSLISDRPAGVCNFLDAPDLVFPTPKSMVKTRQEERDALGLEGERDGGEVKEMEDDTRVIYRHYATLYFVFVVDGAESELGILDLIQVSLHAF